MCRQIKSLAAACAIALVLGACSSNPIPEVDYDVEAHRQLMMEGRAHMSAGRTQDGITSFMGAIDLQPDAEAWYKVGRLYLMQGEEYPAMTAFEQSIDQDEDYVPALQDMGLLLLKWKQNQRAKAVLTHVVERDEDRWQVHNALGVIADLDGLHVAAMAHYERALTLNSTSADVMNNMGYSSFLADDPVAASEYLVDALRHNATHTVAWLNLGKTMARQGRYADAFNIFAERQKRPFAYHDVGYMALLNGDFLRAENYLTKALNDSPTHFDEAYRNRSTARNRMIGNMEGTVVPRRGSEYPYCIGLGVTDC
jgi:Flp pilus assembly protein TadD